MCSLIISPFAELCACVAAACLISAAALPGRLQPHRFELPCHRRCGSAELPSEGRLQVPSVQQARCRAPSRPGTLFSLGPVVDAVVQLILTISAAAVAAVASPAAAGTVPLLKLVFYDKVGLKITDIIDRILVVDLEIIIIGGRFVVLELRETVCTSQQPCLL